MLLDANTVSFQVTRYNPDHTLVIDPTLVYASFLGGSGLDGGNGIAVDSAGNAYVTGITESTEATFPVTVGPDLTANGARDAFVAKVAPSAAPRPPVVGPIPTLSQWGLLLLGGVLAYLGATRLRRLNSR